MPINQLILDESFKQNRAKALLAFPILDELSQYLRTSNNLNGKTIGWHCHLTDLTAYAVEVLLATGTKVHLSECNPQTTSKQAVAFMQALGAQIYLQTNNLQTNDQKTDHLQTDQLSTNNSQANDQPANTSFDNILNQNLDVISDTGFVLTQAFLKRPNKSVIGACEITSSGITILRQTNNLPLPVVNINDSYLKSQIENFHGVGDGVVEALYQLTGKMWSGRRACVIGYGQVGRGVAWHLRQKGLAVTIVETNPVKELIAHYDGFATSSLQQALSSSELAITATGQEFLLTAEHWQYALDGMLLLNVGHLPSEIDRNSLLKLSSGHIAISQHLEEFQMETSTGKKRLYLACASNPANVVLLSGSIEPTLIHLTTEILCWDYLAKLHRQGKSLPPGESTVPTEVEIQVSQFALSALQRTTSAVSAARLS